MTSSSVILLIVATFVSLVAIGIFAAAADQKARKARSHVLSAIPDFSADFRYIAPSGRVGIAIDPTARKFAVSTLDHEPRVFDYDQLLDVQIQRNSEVIHKVNRGSQVAGAAVGTLLLGPVGLLLGGVTGSKRSEEKVRELSLKLSVRDLSRPCEEIPFLFSFKGVNPSDPNVRVALEELEDWYSRFLSILSCQDLVASNT